MIEKVIEIISETIKIPQEELFIESKLEDLGISSFEAIVILCKIEEKFCISIDDSDFTSLSTIGDIVALLQKSQNDII